MKLLVLGLVLGALASFAVAAPVQEKVDVSGAWKMTMETSNGAIYADLTLKVEGDKITGELSSERGALAISGSITAEKVQFSGETNGIVITFSAKPDSKALKGDVDFGGAGGGTWTAARP